jgi:hypothetical protein
MDAWVYAHAAGLSSDGFQKCCGLCLTDVYIVLVANGAAVGTDLCYQHMHMIQNRAKHSADHVRESTAECMAMFAAQDV